MKDWLSEARANPNMLVPFYLMGAYAYYVLDNPIMTDATFDEICRMLDEKWDEVDHMHKPWISRGDLSAGTRMSTLYPSMAKASACALAGMPYHPPVGLLGRCEQLSLALGDLAGAIHVSA